MNKPKNILLVSDSSLHQSIFDKLCEDQEFVICSTVNNTEDITPYVEKNEYDLIIASSQMQNQNLVEFFHKIKDKFSPNKSILFILDKEPSNNILKLYDDLNVDFIYEKYMNLPFLKYTLNASLEKKKNHLLLKENEFRYQKLYDHTLDINLIVNKKYEIIDTNVQGHKHLKIHEDYPLQKIFSRKKDFKRFTQLLNEVEQVSRFEATLIFKKKKVICLIDAFSLYNDNQEKEGAHLVLRNIDESKKSEFLANQANKLMVTGKFLRSLAHEIRNPLTNINLALEQVKHEQDATSDSYVYTEILERSANRIRDILEEIMNAYKTAELDLVPIHLHNVIDNALRFANDRLTLKNIKPKLNLKPKSDLILGDNLKLTTALLNIIVNASEAIGHDNGQIIIKTHSEKTRYVTEISDNGCGMNEEQVKALFDPFYTGKSKGLGLGLTTAQNVIFAHNGSISVKSKINRGTTFYISLPKL